MTDDLFFIPMIAQALSRPDPVAALREAFTQISRMGRQERYRRGFEQFQRFLAESISPGSITSQGSQHIDLPELPKDATSLAVADAEAISELQATLRKLLDESAVELDLPTKLGLTLLRDGHAIAHLVMTLWSGCETVSGLQPGHYELALATGRIIWEDDLADEDLLWPAAFPGKPVPLAADTGQTDEPASRVVSLMEGQVVLHVLPGIESGRLRIRTQTAGSQ